MAPRRQQKLTATTRDAAGSPFIRVGFDVGGTFTDILITASSGHVHTYKVLSTPEEVGVRVAECVREVLAAEPGGQVSSLIHATTVASNTVIQGRGARTGYLTTRGFRDDVEFPRPGRMRATESVGLYWPGTMPLVPRRLRADVTERVSARGAIETPLDVAEAERILSMFAEQQIEALAICLINAYVNPVHEEILGDMARALLPGVHVCLSHHVLPEMREYERASTTVIHAYLAPTIDRYLGRLERQLADASPSLLVMQANGGVVPCEQAKRRPANLIESGPAAGVLAAAAIAKRAKLKTAVALDMGGTTVKACLIADGAPQETVQMEVSTQTATRLVAGTGHALRMSGFDLVEIGAGGGSIAWIDDGGALRVGPQSAGAAPGPACYGRGGTDPTLTDANLVLGYLSPDVLAGGTVVLHRDRAETAIREQIARPTGLSLQDAALGIYRVAIATMTRAVRAVTIARGYDPRECAIVAFGGAGPLHAAAIADDLEIREVHVPPHPGLFSAVGLLSADMRADYVTALPSRLEALDERELDERFAATAAHAQAELASCGVDVAQAAFERFIDLRYVGQAAELTVLVDDEPAVDGDVRMVLAERFHDQHERSYGYRRPGDAIAVSSLRLKLVLAQDTLKVDNLASQAFDARLPSSTSRMAYFGVELGHLATALMTRATLAEGAVIGPVVIEEFDSTVLVPPRWRAQFDNGSIIMTKD